MRNNANEASENFRAFSKALNRRYMKNKIIRYILIALGFLPALMCTGFGLVVFPENPIIGSFFLSCTIIYVMFIVDTVKISNN